jgi:glycerol-3-phosphate dehydrogenase (NAD(P)+)
MNIVVVGAGAWGTALAVKASAKHQVCLWVRNAQAAAEMQQTRSNEGYLPDVVLPVALRLQAVDVTRIEAGAAEDLRAADLIVIATPAAAVPECLRALGANPSMRPGTPVIWLSKGLVWQQEGGQAQLLHEVAAQLSPTLQIGALSGPSFAQEVAKGLPAALVAASPHAQVRAAMLAAFHDAHLRVYANVDLIGVELGGAVKNVLAIAAGVSDGLQLGLNARAALLTRGLAEMTRLGLAMGAKPETFMGLSGIGDLMLTATGNLSRNRRVGLALAKGQPLAAIVQSLGHVAEGVLAAPAVQARAQALGVAMPMVDSVNALLRAQASPISAMQGLMAREPGSEA